MQKQIRLSIICLLFLIGCLSETTVSKQQTDAELSDEELSEKYCSNCHLYTKPALLTKSDWEKVLPNMGNRLGIVSQRYSPLKGKTMEEALAIKMAGVIPKQAILSDTTWQRIVAYYLKTAPDSLSQQTHKPWKESSQFEVQSFPLIKDKTAYVSMVKIDKTNQQIIAGDISGMMKFMSTTGKELQTAIFSTPIMDIQKGKLPDEWLVQTAGIMEPNDLRTGKIYQLIADGHQNKTLLKDDLVRSIQIEVADLDNDTIEDIIVCGVGDELGEVVWLKLEQNAYQTQLIKKIAGASKIKVVDVDQDNDQDIMVLFGRNDEGLSLFVNNNGIFTERRLLRFDPTFGSSDFQVIDIDNDKDLDVIYANGNRDNGYISSLKSYHGIRMYLNEGDFKLKEQFFFPMHGVTKISAADYDLDGDIDVFGTAFYPDFEHTEQALVYLQNQGNFNYTPQSIPIANKGRWMVMDAGDLDADGDEDLVLGAFYLEQENIPKAIKKKWAIADEHIVVLKNNTN